MTPVWLSSWRRSERVSAKKVENLVQRTVPRRPQRPRLRSPKPAAWAAPWV